MRQFIIVPVANHNPHDWEAGIDGTGHRNMQSLAGWLQKEYCPQPQGMQIVHPYTQLCNAHGGALFRYLEHRGWHAPEKLIDDRLAEFSLWQEKVDQMVRDYLVRVNERGLVIIVIPQHLLPQTVVRVGVHFIRCRGMSVRRSLINVLATCCVLIRTHGRCLGSIIVRFFRIVRRKRVCEIKNGSGMEDPSRTIAYNRSIQC